MSILQNQAIVVTGATKGIGLSIANRLASLGANLILNARNTTDLENLKSTLSSQYASLKIVISAGSVADAGYCESLIAETLTAFGKIDCLINNAGVCPPFRLLQEHSIEELSDTIDINLKGPLYLMRFAVPAMVNQESGVIININSVAGKTAYPYSAVYCASKFGLSALTESVASEQQAGNIRIIGVYPGEVNTPMWQTIEPGVQQNPAHALTPEAIADSVQFILTQPPSVHIKELVVVPTNPRTHDPA